MKKIRKCVIVLLIFTLIFSSTVSAAEKGQTQAQANKTKAIVIIPGILGSSLKDYDTGYNVWFDITNYGRMALNENGTSVYNVDSKQDNFGANGTYEELYRQLKNAYRAEYDIIFFDYDFRMSNTDAAAKLAIEINSYSKVVLVTHSMGGLVASKYLANSASNRNKVELVITIGTPFVGAAKCINVMETGELIYFPNTNFALFKSTIKEVSQRSYASYQLLPTSKYYSITGYYPFTINGTNHVNITSLQNTSWGRMSNGSIKPMFAGAISFHNALYNGNVFVKHFNGVNMYTIGGAGIDTISRVVLNSSYEVTDLIYSNNGDGTVLTESAGYGTPNYVGRGTSYGHVELVSNSTVINKVISQIAAETRSTPQNNIALIADIQPTTQEDSVNVNERGWLTGMDNRRINIYAPENASLYLNGDLIEESAEMLYSAEGNPIGHVWALGTSGRKLYALYNGDYTVSCSGEVEIKYMNNGYYEKITEYDTANIDAIYEIRDFSQMTIGCYKLENTHLGIDKGETIFTPTHESTVAEIEILNSD